MKQSFKLSAALILVSALVAGCASVQMASTEQDKAAKQFIASADKAKLYVYRNETLGAALKMPVTLDGKLIGETASKTYFVLEVAPGKHVITSQGTESSLTVDAAAGKTYFVWQEVKMGAFSGGSKLQLVDEAKGKAGVIESKLAATTP